MTQADSVLRVILLNGASNGEEGVRLKAEVELKVDRLSDLLRLNLNPGIFLKEFSALC